ncbi:MAG: 1-deoxy-D-xylulose-5-phosphate synthase, partial [Chlamydiia bacterium]|nr:1-deoxy-D-xylulose-5-phosphate synthase [Chlamydiia bacterium]
MIFDTINSPEDLKKLPIADVKTLATEVRQHIIDVLSQTGGHLGSNLGTIELTLALHYVFDSPKDKLIWDVSHQAYTHKLLTGRKERFPTIRQHKGLCGFTHPGESPHDHFHAGHAGTALSQALGVARARDLDGTDEYVLPIIGDATLTCGMAYEALNNLSRSMKRFIIVLNDNQMSISQNVGAITHILSRLLSNPTTHKIHQELDHLVSKMPYGPFIARQGHKLTGSIKNLVSPGAFFEHFHLSYIGPIDGHDTEKMIEVFEKLKDSESPVIVHLVTKKGQGMEQALNNPVTYHGVKPFDVSTGKFLPNPITKPTFPKIFGQEALAMAEKDPSLLVVTPAMSAGSCLDPFVQKYPERCHDVGIAESHSITYAGGLAHSGKHNVIASIYSTFLQRALDNVFHDVCLQEIPLVLALDRGGLAGGDGATHNGIYDISFLNAMPNMVICQPRNGKLLRELLQSAFSWKRPTAIRYPNLPTEDATENLKSRPLGKGEIIATGEGILILALGHMVDIALQTREILAEQGISSTVVDPIFVKPLDTELLQELLETHHTVITIEEHALS